MLAASPAVEVAVVSPRCGPPEPTAVALRSFLHRCFSANSARLLLLPGVQRSWPGDGRAVIGIAAELGAAALFETAGPTGGRWAASTPHGEPLRTAIHQTFATSAEVDANPALVDALLAACQPGGHRTVEVAGTHVGLLSCGEINVLRNAQSDNNRVSVRHHPGAPIFEHVPIIFNGAHTNMGNWGKLDKRFEFLSRRGRLALYATNNAPNRASWRTALRAWYDGEKLADGEEVFAPGRLSVRLVEDPEDQFRGLVLRWVGALPARG